ncbi:hypothetical protein F5B19DRAFT_478114 [Rostrohypoxylon terebratum]|nr:hypothetical protein F5B19DRAFT_478114 [Rostrohypoxylon terebratum]
MASSQGRGFSQNQLYRWDPILDSRRKLSDQHSQPFIDALSEHDLASDFVTSFMQSCDENDTCNYATEAVVKFCLGADLQSLEHSTRATTELVALLDNGAGLTAWGLYQALRQPKKEAFGCRMYIHNGRIQKSTGTGSPSRQQAMRAQDQHLNIQKVYIPNLTPWTIIALTASAPRYQAGILGKFVSNHLRSDLLINASIHSFLTSFGFQFQLPFFALRKHRLPRRDTRNLRQYEDITFLRTMGSKFDNRPTEYIYESKISCLIIGTSRYSWTGFLINDQYFETEDEIDSIEEYIDQRREGTMPDPFAAGKKPMGDLPSDPRELFLITFEIHLRRVSKEFHEVSMAVDEAVRLYTKDFWEQKICRGSFGNDHRKIPDMDKHRSKLREEHQEWMRRSVELLRRFIYTLDQYSDKWKAFSDTGQNYFISTENPSYSEGLRKSLRDVHQHISELEGLRGNFKHTLERCEDMSHFFNLRIAVEGGESAFSQQKTARDVKVLTWITFLSLPFALAASLLSTQEGYIPINPSPGALVASIVILEGAVWLILGSLLGWDWFKTRVNGLLPHQLRFRNIETEELEGQ